MTIEKVVFHLARTWPPVSPVRKPDHGSKTIYGDIKAGRKTSEWRKASQYWITRLCRVPAYVHELVLFTNPAEDDQDLTKYLKGEQAWFVEGYPKRLLPRLEADVTGLIYHPDGNQLETQFANVREITR